MLSRRVFIRDFLLNLLLTCTSSGERTDVGEHTAPTRLVTFSEGNFETLQGFSLGLVFNCIDLLLHALATMLEAALLVLFCDGFQDLWWTLFTPQPIEKGFHSASLSPSKLF